MGRRSFRIDAFRVNGCSGVGGGGGGGFGVGGAGGSSSETTHGFAG